jgi:hypothetical protein
MAVGLVALLVLVVTVLVACGDGDGSATRVAHPRTSGTAIIEVTSSGGIAPPELRVSDTLPVAWLAGDGRYLAPSDDGVSPPALVPVVERRLTEPAIQRLLQDARRAGLLEPDADYGTPKIFDAVNTRVVVVADGRRHDIVVQALGYPVTDLDDATLAARAEVSRFVGELTEPGSLPGGERAQPYVPTEVAVFVLGSATSDLAPVTWPLGDLATLGTPTRWPTEAARCFVVSGDEVATLSAIATQTPRLTPWQSGDGRWQLALRPLLPDEHTCGDVVP